jgi:hypothetical protein
LYMLESLSKPSRNSSVCRSMLALCMHIHSAVRRPLPPGFSCTNWSVFTFSCAFVVCIISCTCGLFCASIRPRAASTLGLMRYVMFVSMYACYVYYVR